MTGGGRTRRSPGAPPNAAVLARAPRYLLELAAEGSRSCAPGAAPRRGRCPPGSVPPTARPRHANAHKVREVRRLVAPGGDRGRATPRRGRAAARGRRRRSRGNALPKARAAAGARRPAIADDSGLESPRSAARPASRSRATPGRARPTGEPPKLLARGPRPAPLAVRRARSAYVEPAGQRACYGGRARAGMADRAAWSERLRLRPGLHPDAARRPHDARAGPSPRRTRSATAARPSARSRWIGS